MSGLAWLNELMLWLGKWFPRLMLVRAGSVAVIFHRGGRIREGLPGLYCYWPITTDLVVVSTRRRTNEIAAQLCGREAVSVCVEYTLERPINVLMAYNDVFSQLDDRTQAHLGLAYRPEIASTDLCDQILNGLRGEFETNGLSFHTVSIVTRGRVIPLKNLNDWAQHAKAVL